MAELTDEQIKAVAQRDECLRPAQGDGYELDEVAFARAILALSATGAEDAELLNWLREESCDLRCIDIPTGQGDGDVDWIVIGHYQAAPCEREVGRSYSDEPREAIRDAMSRARTQSNGAAGGGEVSHGE